MAIYGQVAEGFEPVRSAFESNFLERSEVGSSFAAYVGGQKVVDLWGGESAPGREWAEDSLVPVWSATKGITALTLQILEETGRIDLESTVASLWPEFGANGKEEIRIIDVLSHGARLPFVPGYSSIATADSPKGWADTTALVELLAQAVPIHPVGAHGYHALTFGLLLGEVVRRATGSTVGSLIRSEIADPLGVEIYVGLPEAVSSRVASLSLTVPPPPTDDPEILAMMAEAMGPNGPVGQALFVGNNGVGGYAEIGNDPAFQASEQPAANGITNARSLARVYSLLAAGGSLDGVSLLSPESVAKYSALQWSGTDATLGDEKRYSSGYMLAGTPAETFGPNPDAFGHPGMGGSLGFADPAAGVGFGYVTNHMVFEVAIDPRAIALADALYGCL